ncbi:hypothetical protein [Maritalea sp.]|uniref:hypothetical protein n=1 Tax=Maritalea sp. TaxID=2003361 RepID=UPI003EF26D1D
MAYVSTHRRQGFSFGISQLMILATHVSLFWVRVVQTYNQQKTHKVLKGLSAEQLNDIGLSRENVRELVQVGRDQAVWRLNSARKKASGL